jgi:hypothetical protein
VATSQHCSCCIIVARRQLKNVLVGSNGDRGRQLKTGWRRDSSFDWVGCRRQHQHSRCFLGTALDFKLWDFWIHIRPSFIKFSFEHLALIGLLHSAFFKIFQFCVSFFSLCCSCFSIATVPLKTNAVYIFFASYCPPPVWLETYVFIAWGVD